MSSHDSSCSASIAPRVHVAVGLIIDDQRRVLIGKRSHQQHQGGLWEFPGGKLERGETVLQALTRELLEELEIVVDEAEPFLEVAHDYGDKQVLLDVWKVLRFTGTPRGAEQQPLRWVAVDVLHDYAFPAANQPIVSAAVALLNESDAPCA